MLHQEMDIDEATHDHPADALAPWIFEQQKIWVDFEGQAHPIERMSADHARNAMRFCEQRAERIWQMMVCNGIFAALGAVFFDPEGEDQATEELQGIQEQEPTSWLETTPLMQALRRRAAIAH